MRETTIRLTEEAHRRIAALVGARKMPAFVREAVERELARREREEREGL